MEERRSSHDRTIVPLRASLIALGLILLIFLAYEIMDSTRLLGADVRVRHFVQTLLGVGASVVLAVVLGWHILRTGPSIFPSEPVDGGDLGEGNGGIRDRALHFSMWFIVMRQIAYTVATILIVIVVKVLRLLPDETFLPLALLVVCIIVSNIFFILCLRRGWFTRHLLELQSVTDISILTAMLHYSGGIENPLSFVYIFHIIIGGVLLDRRRCYAVVGISMFLFSVLALAEMEGFIEHYALLLFPHGGEGSEELCAAHRTSYVVSLVLMQMLLMSLSAYFTTTIMDRLRWGEKRALADRQRLEYVVEATGAGLAVLDKDLHPVWLNERMQKWLDGHDMSEGSAFVPPGGGNGAEMKTLSDGKVRVVERRLDDGKGGKRFFQVTIAPLTDDAGRVFQLVELTQDITQRKTVEAEMMYSARMAALGFMAAGIAHEVGNPLASISARLRLLEDDKDETFLDESHRLIQGQIGRIERIVRGISQFARSPRDEWAACDINSIISELIKVLKLHKFAKHCEIRFLPHGEIPTIMGVRDQLAQVFLNLGINALQAMPHGGTVTVTASTDGDDVRIGFADTGEGMPEDVRSQIFTPFFTTKIDGLGLGLSVVHNIVSAHGGRIDVDSTHGSETVLTVVLPIRIPGDEINIVHEVEL